MAEFDHKHLPDLLPPGCEYLPTTEHLLSSGSESSYLSEESLAASSGGCRVIDVDIVVFSTHGFLHEGFGEHLPVHLNVVLPLHKVTLCTWTHFIRQSLAISHGDGTDKESAQLRLYFVHLSRRLVVQQIIQQ